MTTRAESQGATANDIATVAKQIGSALLPDNGQWMNRFQVKSASSTTSLYTVAQRRSDKVWGCSCPGWRHYRHCKHTADVLERLAFVAATAVPSAYDQPTVSMLASARTAYLELEPIKMKRGAVPVAKARVLDLD